MQHGKNSTFDIEQWHQRQPRLNFFCGNSGPQRMLQPQGIPEPQGSHHATAM
jgi:hypothetical protein